MCFLLDGNLPRSAAPMLRELGHDAVDVGDIGLRSAQTTSLRTTRGVTD